MKHQLNQTPKDLREKIVLEYLTSDMSAKELAVKYGMPHGNTIIKWASLLSKEKKTLSLSAEMESTAGMAKKTLSGPDAEVERLRQRVKELESRLRERDLECRMLNAFIEVAEENGYNIRKKSGAK